MLSGSFILQNRFYNYKPLTLSDNRLWIPHLQLGLGTWQGNYQGIDRLWLRWFDATGHWILTAEEQAMAAERALVEEQQRSQRLAEKRRALGVDPDDI